MDFNDIVDSILVKPYYLDREAGQVIYCSDNRLILPLIPDKCVDLCLTDPPYFIPSISYTGKRGEGYSRKLIGDTSILGMAFELVFQHYIDHAVKEDGNYYVFCDSQSYPLVWQTLYPVCYSVRALVWDKITSYNGYTWRRQYELIAWGRKPKTQNVPTGDGDILHFHAVKVDDREHPAEKPPELLNQIVGKHPAELILDPFLGSGTTLVCAKKLGRKAIGIEIEETYAAIAAKRLSQAVMKLEC